MIKNCDNCGGNLNLEKNKVTENNFCNKGCYHEWLSDEMSGDGNHQYIDGSSPQGFTDRERREIFERDEHDLDNGITLCISCHADKHENRGEDSIAQLIRGQMS